MKRKFIFSSRKTKYSKSYLFFKSIKLTFGQIRVIYLNSKFIFKAYLNTISNKQFFFLYNSLQGNTIKTQLYS